MTLEDFEYSSQVITTTFMVLLWFFFWLCRAWQPQCIIKRVILQKLIFCVPQKAYMFEITRGWMIPFKLLQCIIQFKPAGSVRGRREKDQKKPPLREKWKERERIKKRVKMVEKCSSKGFCLSSVLYIEIWWLLTIVSSLLPLSRCLYPWGVSRGPTALHSWELPWVIGPPPDPPTMLARTERSV